MARESASDASDTVRKRIAALASSDDADESQLGAALRGLLHGESLVDLRESALTDLDVLQVVAPLLAENGTNTASLR